MATFYTESVSNGADIRNPYYQELKGRIHQELLGRLNLERLTRVKREEAEPEIRSLVEKTGFAIEEEFINGNTYHFVARKPSSGLP